MKPKWIIRVISIHFERNVHRFIKTDVRRTLVPQEERKSDFYTHTLLFVHYLYVTLNDIVCSWCFRLHAFVEWMNEWILEKCWISICLNNMSSHLSRVHNLSFIGWIQNDKGWPTPALLPTFCDMIKAKEIYVACIRKWSQRKLAIYIFSCNRKDELASNLPTTLPNA